MSSIQTLLTSTTLFALATGCTPIIPIELSDARNAYQEAVQGNPAKVVPGELASAKLALDDAEAAYKRKPRAPETRDLAYVAHRKVLRVVSLANLVDLERTRAQADQEHATKQARLLEEEKEKLATSETRLEGSKAQLTYSRAQLAETLAKLAEVREDARGMVVTLSGNILFTTGSDELLPGARPRLEQIAAALLAADKECSIDIEGHTDSKGSQSRNEDLSQRRAETVRDVLIASGCSRDRIRAVGIGETSPIANNASPAGRAANRRVELILRGTWTKESP